MKKLLLISLFILLFNGLYSQNNSQFISQTAPPSVGLSESFSVSVTFKNTGTTTWKSSDGYKLGTQSPQDNSIWGVGTRVALPGSVAPGTQVTFNVELTAPSTGDGYGVALQWRMLKEGVAWFGDYSEAVSIIVGFDILPDSLLTEGTPFSISNHIVATSMFHWYGSNTGQKSGPWMPVEGRENWTGEPDFFKRMIKQLMAANIDVLYVHLIPTMEQQRINLFQALNQLRREGWNVPKISPFFDALITCDIIGHNINVNTKSGRDEFVGHYIRFYNQYYSVNQDEYADDYIYTIDGKVVLDTWHVHLNLINYNTLRRYDIESRLKESFGVEHDIFRNGIYMVTTAISPTFTFADEKVHQFEVHEYFIKKSHGNITSAQIKPGYWDQNVRNPGYILKRNGGSKYTNAWANVNSSVDRIYIESFNEYDEGSGIYAANPDEIHKVGGNTSNDTWSATNDPYEYIKTTAAGAANFNDDKKLDAKIIWHNIPDEMGVGETFTAKVIVRNEGNEQWSAANNFKFGQQDSDPEIFGSNRYLIDDTQNDISEYDGIFRGRALTFNLEIVAPETEGEFVTHWGMLQEDVAWFGEVLEKSIVVSKTTGINQQSTIKEFTIYPNPVALTSSIHIKGNLKKSDRIIFTSINGNKIFEKEIQNNVKNFSLHLQKNNIVEGVYIIQIISNNSIQTKKILVKN